MYGIENEIAADLTRLVPRYEDQGSGKTDRGFDFTGARAVLKYEEALALASGLRHIPHDTGDNMRLDAGKVQFERLPPEALFALAELYTNACNKYPQDGGRGWEKGMSWGRCFGSMMRHAWKFWRGEDYDEETGAHHMVAVMWNAVAIYIYAVRKVGTDDRPVKS